MIARAEIEVTARGLPAELWRPLLNTAPALPFPAVGPDTAITVVVPHPDDETLGAGGLLHRLTAAGAVVTVVFVTDGAAGYPGCTPAQAAELSALRRAEALTALRVLGLPDTAAVFLDVPDGTVTAAEDELADRLESWLTGFGAGPGDERRKLILAPWPDDPHPDHQATGRAAALAADRAAVTLWQYPIWMRHSIRPEDPIVDVEHLQVLRLSPAERAAKQSAIDTHASQLRSPFPGYGPVLPDHVLDLFADGLEPFFVPGGGR